MKNPIYSEHPPTPTPTPPLQTVRCATLVTDPGFSRAGIIFLKETNSVTISSDY